MTIELDADRAAALSALAELYHATPERMVASWARYHIDRLRSGLTPDTMPSGWQPDSAADAARLRLPDGVADRCPAASLDAVAAADAALGHGLGEQLRALYAVCDGFLMPDGIRVYCVEDIAERNATFDVASAAPGFVLFADDSGGRGFLLDPRAPGSAVYTSVLRDLDPGDFEIVAGDLASWIGLLTTGETRS